MVGSRDIATEAIAGVSAGVIGTLIGKTLQLHQHVDSMFTAALVNLHVGKLDAVRTLCHPLTFQYLLLVAGACEGHPLDTIKTSLQAQSRHASGRSRGIQDAARDIARRGMGGFYRGVGGPLVSLTIVRLDHCIDTLL